MTGICVACAKLSTERKQVCRVMLMLMMIADQDPHFSVLTTRGNTCKQDDPNGCTNKWNNREVEAPRCLTTAVSSACVSIFRRCLFV